MPNKEQPEAPKESRFQRIMMSRKTTLVLDLIVAAFIILNIVRAIVTDDREGLAILAVFGWVTALMFFMAYKGEERWTRLYRGMANDTLAMLDNVMKILEGARETAEKSAKKPSKK